MYKGFPIYNNKGVILSFSQMTLPYLLYPLAERAIPAMSVPNLDYLSSA
jgi:hypothetical protein